MTGFYISSSETDSRPYHESFILTTGETLHQLRTVVSTITNVRLPQNDDLNYTICLSSRVV